MRRVVFTTLCCAFLHCLCSGAQTPGILYTTPGDSDEGSFSFPRGYPLYLQEGSTINITWSTTLETINLYYYQRGTVEIPNRIATELADNWYEWNVFVGEEDLTEPFVFHAVQAQGAADSDEGGEFWSTSYYISRTSTQEPSPGPETDPVQEPRPTISTIPDSSTQAEPESTRTPSTTSTLVLTLTAKYTATLTSTPASDYTPTLRTTFSSSLSDSSTPTSSGQQPGQLPDLPARPSINESVVVGLAAGFGLAFIVAVASLLLLLLRRQQRKSEVAQGVCDSASSPESEMRLKEQDVTPVRHEVYVWPTEMQGEKPRFELPTTKHTSCKSETGSQRKEESF